VTGPVERARFEIQSGGIACVWIAGTMKGLWDRGGSRGDGKGLDFALLKALERLGKARLTLESLLLRCFSRGQLCSSRFPLCCAALALRYSVPSYSLRLR
jgi:hypothetical protein